MAEFSTTTRLVATLLLLLVSVAVWRWVLAPARSQSPSESQIKKPKKKKKNTKKKAPAAAVDGNVPTEALSATAAELAASSAPASDSDEDTDEDAGLSAKQVLAKRRFKPKAIGGGSATTTAALPNAVKFQVNQRVVARFEDGRDWFPGVIIEVRRGNEYHIKYDDGAIEHHVPHSRIKDAAVEKEPRSSKRIDSEKDVVPPRVPTDSGRSEADDEATGSGDVDSDSAVGDSDDGGNDGDDSEDGWQVVSTATKKSRKPLAAAGAVSAGEKVDAEGLTKRQRENRRKKERKKEVKELVRSQAQEQGLHARWGGTMTRLKYVPPPTAPSGN